MRRPEKDTQPKLFYRHGTQATLDPLAAERPDGGTFMWSEQRTGGQYVVGGHPAEANRQGSNSSAAAMLAYDIPHKAPWDWRVSLYTVTKAISAGAYLVPLLLLLAGKIAATSPLWTWGAPILGLAFLAITGGLLISDLTHPLRFYMIFTRPQWRSWLVRGSFLIAGYGARADAASRCRLAAEGRSSCCRSPPPARRSRSPPRSTPRSFSPRRKRGISGRARSCLRTWRCKRCSPAPARPCCWHSR